MFRRTVSGIMLTLMLTSMLTLAFNMRVRNTISPLIPQQSIVNASVTDSSLNPQKLVSIPSGVDRFYLSKDDEAVVLQKCSNAFEHGNRHDLTEKWKNATLGRVFLEYNILQKEVQWIASVQKDGYCIGTLALEANGDVGWVSPNDGFSLEASFETAKASLVRYADDESGPELMTFGGEHYWFLNASGIAYLVDVSSGSVTTKAMDELLSSATLAQPGPPTAHGNTQIQPRLVPYFNQGAKSWCCSYSTTMVLGWWGLNQALSNHDQCAYDIARVGQGTDPPNVNNGVYLGCACYAVGQLYGYLTRWHGQMKSITSCNDNSNSIDDLKYDLYEGYPVAIEVDCDGNPSTTNDLHICVLIGYDDTTNFVYVNDPSGAWTWSGGDTYVSYTNLESRWGAWDNNWPLAGFPDKDSPSDWLVHYHKHLGMVLYPGDWVLTKPVCSLTAPPGTITDKDTITLTASLSCSGQGAGYSGIHVRVVGGSIISYSSPDFTETAYDANANPVSLPAPVVEFYRTAMSTGITYTASVTIAPTAPGSMSIYYRGWANDINDVVHCNYNLDNVNPWQTLLHTTTVYDDRYSTPISMPRVEQWTQRDPSDWADDRYVGSKFTLYSCKSYTVIVARSFDFSVGASPSSRSVTAGGSTSYQVTVTLLSGATQSVSLSCSPSITGVTFSFSPSSGNPTFTSTLTVQTSSGTPANTYTLTITGSGGGQTHSTTVQLIVMVGGLVYYSVEPVAVSPLADINGSINGLEIAAAPSPVNLVFNVEIHLRNATLTNVPAGVASLEVHFYFGNILSYAVPTAFINNLGQPGGVLTGPSVLYGINPGFYDASGNQVSSPPYAGAVYFEIAAASTSGPWWGADGLVAIITFRIIKQPQGSLGEPTVTLQVANDFTDLPDENLVSVPHFRVQGTLTIDASPVVPTYLVVRGTDSRIYYRTSPGDSWGDWNVLPGATCDSPVATVYQGQLWIVIRGMDGNTLWYGKLTNPADPTSFSGWSLLDGATNSAPTLASNGTALCLVVRGLDNSVYCRCYSEGVWGQWYAVPTGATPDAPAASMLGNDLHIVVRGMDGSSLWDTIVSCDGTVVRGWSLLSGATPSKPVLVCSGSDSECLAVRGMDNRIYYRNYTGSTYSWGDWSALPTGATIDGPGATIVGSELCMVVRGMDGSTLWCGDIDLGTSSFTGWTLLSGATPSAPTLTS